MTRVPTFPSSKPDADSSIDAAVLALARLLGEAAGREACAQIPDAKEQADDAEQPQDQD
ncbi:hypothetical protein KTJ87_17730 [Rhodobacteraceae bacterium ASV31]|nr:hypothetical protein [Anianabacter salinae]